jgi:hypothetical protein
MGKTFLVYKTSRGQTKVPIRVPQKRHGLGINKVREGYVEYAFFRRNPKQAGYGSNNYVSRTRNIPKTARNVRITTARR